MRIFITDDKISDKVVTIDGSDALHLIRSLRITRGEKITVCDMSRREYLCEAEQITADTVIARVVSSRDSENEPLYRATAYLALSKGERFELAVQKSVELGVTELVPFESERTIISSSDAAKKLARWRKIASEAAKQCGRAIIPQVRDPISYSGVVAELADASGLRFICYEGDGTKSLAELLRGQTANDTAMRDISVPDRISFVIGPEGGFSAREAEAARAADIALCGLGKRILRCETAPMYVLSALSYQFELIAPINK